MKNSTLRLTHFINWIWPLVLITSCRNLSEDKNCCCNKLSVKDSFVTRKVIIDTIYETVKIRKENIPPANWHPYLNTIAFKSDHYTNDQGIYLTTLYLFLSTKPNTEQFLTWQNQHPIPFNLKEENYRDSL